MKNTSPLNYLSNLTISPDEANFSNGHSATNANSQTHMSNENNNADAANLTPAIQPAHQAAVSQEASTAVTQPGTPPAETVMTYEQSSRSTDDIPTQQLVAILEQRRRNERLSLLNSIIQNKAAVLRDLDSLEERNEQELQRKGTADNGFAQVEQELVGVLKICGPVPLTLLQNVFIDQDLKKARKALVDKGLLAEAQVGNSKVLSLTEEDKAAA